LLAQSLGGKHTDDDQDMAVGRRTSLQSLQRRRDLAVEVTRYLYSFALLRPGKRFYAIIYNFTIPCRHHREFIGTMCGIYIVGNVHVKHFRYVRIWQILDR
jgi:hypothetical protein